MMAIEHNKFLVDPLFGINNFGGKYYMVSDIVPIPITALLNGNKRSLEIYWNLFFYKKIFHIFQLLKSHFSILWIGCWSTMQIVYELVVISIYGMSMLKYQSQPYVWNSLLNVEIWIARTICHWSTSSAIIDENQLRRKFSVLSAHIFNGPLL